MRLLAVASLSFFLFLGLQQQDKKPQTTQQSTQQEQCRTQDFPLIVKVLPAEKSAQETKQEAEDRKEKAASDRNLVDATWVLAGIGVLQLFVFGAQALMLKKTVQSAGEQSTAMERHIGEANRSANAMEAIANKIDAGNQMIMRAYVTAVIGAAVFQQRREGQSDLKFEGKVQVSNTGNSAARKVRIRKRAAILPNPMPDNFDFSLPEDVSDSTYASMGAHQSYVISSIVPDFVPNAEVAAIKEGDRQALVIWGIITYEDIFGKSHHTRFAHLLTWLPNGQIWGIYIPDQNDTE